MIILYSVGLGVWLKDLNISTKSQRKIPISVSNYGCHLFTLGLFWQEIIRKGKRHHHSRIIDSDHQRENRDSTQWGHGKICLHWDNPFDFLLELFLPNFEGKWTSKAKHHSLRRDIVSRSPGPFMNVGMCHAMRKSSSTAEVLGKIYLK